MTGSNPDSERVVQALQIPGVMLVAKPVKITTLPALIQSLFRHWTEDSREVSSAAVIARNADPNRALRGEDLSTTDHNEAMRWVKTYKGLLQYKQSMLEQTRRTAKESDSATASELEETDIPFLEAERSRFESRRDAWRERLRQLEPS